jgi:MIP family channel proteins
LYIRISRVAGDDEPILDAFLNDKNNGRSRLALLERRLRSALIAEMYGTFVLTFLGPLSITVVKNPIIFPGASSLGLGFIGLTHGIALLIGIASVAHISGAHFNPAVTIGLAYAGKFPRPRVLPYIGAHLLGGAIAGFVQLAIVGQAAAATADLGNTTPNLLLPLWMFSSLLAEIVGTLILVVTILASSESGLTWGGASIGLSLAAVIWGLGAISGASLNPARTFGTTLASFSFDPAAFNTFWIYVVGPILGGLLAAELYTRMAKA